MLVPELMCQLLRLSRANSRGIGAGNGLGAALFIFEPVTLGLPTFDLVEIETSEVWLHAIALESECLTEAVATAKSIGCWLAAQVTDFEAEGDWHPTRLC
jgi:hypothetical protein